MTTSNEVRTTGSLEVPGASLYYDVSGSGPVLLMIPGGAADADVFAPIADDLADRYTVVRYDPRGISRSHFTGPAQDVPVALHADDAHLLLAALGSEPAFVLGSSGGAVIGLALAERYPAQVRTLVAHEPPLVEFLPTGDARRPGAKAIYDTYRKEGVGAAMQLFIALTGLGEPEPPGEPDPAMQEAMAQRMARMQQNVEFFLAHYMRPIIGYLPDDVAALQEGSPRVVVGVGEDAAGQLANDTALALAARLGTLAVTFPGGHSGYFTHPKAFAAKLDEVLQTTG